MSGQEEFYKCCVKLFGKKSVKRTDYLSPLALEIEINPLNASDLFNEIEPINVFFYYSSIPHFFMHLGNDYVFEYSDEQTAIEVFNKYLTAIAEKRLKIDRRKFLGLTYSKKLKLLE